MESDSKNQLGYVLVRVKNKKEMFSGTVMVAKVKNDKALWCVSLQLDGCLRVKRGGYVRIEDEMKMVVGSVF